jgi:hypothetical protein
LQGLDIDQARDGHEGLLLAGSGSYEVTIVDRMLPALGALTLVKHLRESSLNPRGCESMARPLQRRGAPSRGRAQVRLRGSRVCSCSADVNSRRYRGDNSMAPSNHAQIVMEQGMMIAEVNMAIGAIDRILKMMKDGRSNNRELL